MIDPPDAAAIARKLASSANAMALLACQSTLLIAAYHLALAIFFHRSPA